MIPNQLLHSMGRIILTALISRELTKYMAHRSIQPLVNALPEDQEPLNLQQSKVNLDYLMSAILELTAGPHTPNTSTAG